MSLSHKELEEYILSKPGTWLDYPFGEGVAVYKIGSKETASSTTQNTRRDTAGSPGGKMFALISDGSDPANISLKCDPLLAQQLREKYVTVMPGYHLNKKLWNTILATGEIEKDYLFSLVDLSYQLVVDGLTKDERAKLSL